jgi:Flp pilus assembly protein CpaB
MHRSPRVILAWTIVVVVAIATARFVASDLAALHRRARNLGPDIRVLLAARDLPLGATIGTGDVRTVIRPASTVPPDAMRDGGDVTGRVVAVDLARDDVIRAVHLASRDRTGLDGIVPVGRRAVHVAIKDGFRPRMGAVVDVLAAFDPALGGPGTRHTAITVARGARVLGVDDVAQSGAEGGAGVTLLVTEGEASEVAYAAGNGELSVALAPPEAACCTSSSISSAR